MALCETMKCSVNKVNIYRSDSNLVAAKRKKSLLTSYHVSRAEKFRFAEILNKFTKHAVLDSSLLLLSDNSEETPTINPVI